MLTLMCLVLPGIAGCAGNEVTPAISTTASALETTGNRHVVQRGTVTRKLEFTGRVAPVEELPLYFKTSGYVKQVLVQAGDHVKAGDLLAELEMDGQRDQIALAELDLELARARLKQAEEANEYAARQAEMALELAQTRLAAAEEVGGYEIVIQQIAVDQAQAELERLRKGVNPVLELEVQRAQQVLQYLRESSQITSPADGEVISVSLYPGRPVEAFVPVVVIADPSAIEVSASLTDDQLQHVAEGQQARVVLSSDSGRTWTGTVRRLPYPYGTGGSVESPIGIDVSTRISLEGDVGDLEFGARVHVTIVLEEKRDVLWLPPAAVRTLQGRRFVTVQDGARQRRVDVELGLESPDRVEILEGLQERQVVVTP